MNTNPDLEDKANAFKEAELKKFAELNYQQLSKMIGREKITSPKGLEEFNFSYEISESEDEALEVNVFNHDLPPYDQGYVEDYEDEDVIMGETRMCVWFFIYEDNAIDWWSDESPDDYPMEEHEHDPRSPYMSVRIESQTADKRRSLRVHEVRLPLVPDPEEPGFFQSDEDYFYKLDNGESLKVSSSWEPSDEELEFSVDVKYKNASISQSGKSGLLINFCHKRELVVVVRVGSVD